MHTCAFKHGEFMLNNFIRKGLFPTWLSLGLLGALLGIEFGWPIEFLVMSIAILTVAVVHISERRVPFKERWNKGVGDTQADFISLAVVLGALEPLSKLLTAWLLSMLLASLAYMSEWRVFPSDWPLLAQLLIFALGTEFGRYWIHRFSHRNEYLWRFHASHHSAERLYQFNGYRIHPVNYLWNYVLGQLPLILLGASEDVVMLYFVLSSIVAAFQHANIESQNGMLNWIFSTNELHRWHHTTDRRIGDKNHGSVLIVWDLVFGSYFLPAKNQKLGDVGLSSPMAYPVTNYFRQLVVPFCWRKCVTDVSTNNVSDRGE